MAYQIYKFDDTLLPLYDSSQTHSPGDVNSGLLESAGGAFDAFGSDRRYPRIIGIDVDGWYVGEEAYEVDASGDFIVDESGNYIITHGGSVDLRVQVEALQSKIGVKGTLWRRWISDNTTEQWKTARLMRVPFTLEAEDGCVVADITCLFETFHVGWRAETATTSAVSATDGASTHLLSTVSGDLPVYDAVLTVACTSGTITQVDVTNNDDVDWTWRGSLATANTLEFNFGEQQTIRTGSTDQYDGFTLNSGHSASSWMPLPLGNSSWFVTVTGGNATVTLTHYDQYA